MSSLGGVSNLQSTRSPQWLQLFKRHSVLFDKICQKYAFHQLLNLATQATCIQSFSKSAFALGRFKYTTMTTGHLPGMLGRITVFPQERRQPSVYRAQNRNKFSMVVFVHRSGIVNKSSKYNFETGSFIGRSTKRTKAKVSEYTSNLHAHMHI